MSFDDATLQRAHRHCFENKRDIDRSTMVGCFYCLKIYAAAEVSQFTQDRNAPTAICPRCDIDSVIGDASGFDITKEFLVSMHERWFFPLPPQARR